MASLVYESGRPEIHNCNSVSSEIVLYTFVSNIFYAQLIWQAQDSNCRRSICLQRLMNERHLHGRVPDTSPDVMNLAGLRFIL